MNQNWYLQGEKYEDNFSSFDTFGMCGPSYIPGCTCSPLLRAVVLEASWLLQTMPLKASSVIVPRDDNRRNPCPHVTLPPDLMPVVCSLSIAPKTSCLLGANKYFHSNQSHTASRCDGMSLRSRARSAICSSSLPVPCLLDSH